MNLSRPLLLLLLVLTTVAVGAPPEPRVAIQPLGEVPDWGIFGLGQLDRRPCVVSTFRLGRGVPLATMHRRIGDVAGHEIGHTFNLPHCATPRCRMNDAGGKVKVVDDSTGELCPACREKLGELVTGR
ncbi:MAG: hypothetical protein DVB27_03935 [Verrucomicrobia bacterium]|nr:MAG: hypothetical protein DVB27_03935 [Verrucomicrobiota bacterium]